MKSHEQHHTEPLSLNFRVLQLIGVCKLGNLTIATIYIYPPSSDLDIFGGGGSPTSLSLLLDASAGWEPYQPPHPGNQPCSKPLASVVGLASLATLVSGLVV